jgi:glycogen debranching enzyme
VQVDLPISHAGAFVYWVEYDGNNGERLKGRSGYFNIDPVLKTKARTPILDIDLRVLPPNKGGVLKETQVNLPLNGLSILTVVSKWMGPLEDWEKHFIEAKERGYTMLHYTPLQERGESDSPYSIRNQLKYDPSLFGSDLNENAGRKRIEEILKVAHDEYGLLSLTDVVLNHTANDSPWLLDHPEAGYSPANSPHLTPALELDSAIIEFSGSLIAKGLPTTVSSEGDINVLIDAFGHAVRDLNLWQYYVLDPKREKDSVKDALASGKIEAWSGPNVKNKVVGELADIFRTEKEILGLGALASRFSVRVDSAVAAGFVQAAFTDLKDSEALANAWVKVVDILNVSLYRECADDTKTAIGNVRNRLKHTRFDSHGPKLGEITKQ